MDDKNEIINGPFVFLPLNVKLVFLGILPTTGLFIFCSGVDYLHNVISNYTKYTPLGEFWWIHTIYVATALLFVFFLFCVGGAYIIAFGLAAASEGLARYQFCDEGLRVKYPLSKWALTPWEDFHQICICYGFYSTKGPSQAGTIICFVRKGAKKNIYGRWKSYNPIHHRKVIDLDLEPDLLLKLQLKCTAPIVDLRGYGNYRHPTNARPDIKLKTKEELQAFMEKEKR